MPTYPFMQVDAFTKRPLAGNPCAIIFDADSLSDSQMLAIAKEMNLSETAFVLKSEIADVRARYFTPAEEIPLAGHPTIATIHALVETGQVQLPGDYTKISLELQVGPIPIELYATESGVRVVMNQKKPQFLATLSPEEVMPHFGLETADCLPNAPAQIVSTGTPQLMIPVRNLEALRRARLNTATYPAFRQKAGFFSPHLFCLQGATDQGDSFARHFGVPPDTMEDPFTGSATGGMAAYLWHHHLIDKPTFTAEQGHWMNRPGQAQVEVVGPPDNIETVKVGGTAVTVMRGKLTI
ncbi:MAG: PhzF family phenazine biosynthesis protein [Ardenticatenaceae bacterium]|nr:PhzF family phenazine biosynthesis protein [Ardenticatenaceae bacterium]